MRPDSTPTNILVAGIYWSGSGAVVDYLKGHPDCVVPRGEFTDFKSSGRIADLLTAPSPRQAKTLATRMGLHILFQRLPVAFVRELGGKPAKPVPLKEQFAHNRLKLAWLRRYRTHLKAGGDHRDPGLWRQWVHQMGKTHAPGKAAIVWNQPVWIGQHEQVWPTVFSPYKAVVVHRDPVDQFAEVVRKGKLGKRKSDPAFPAAEKDPVAYVLKGIARKQQSLLELHERLGAERLLIVSFEDFVLNHDREAKGLCRFLGLPLAQQENAPFVPEESARNIGIGEAEAVRETLAPYQAQLSQLQQLHRRLKAVGEGSAA